MPLQRWSWVWLYIRMGAILGVILGREPSIPEQHGENSCYQLNRLYCNFQEAETYCHAQGGRLAHTWNPKLQDLLQSSRKKETVWWVGENLKLPRKQSGVTQTGRALASRAEGKSFLVPCSRVKESYLSIFILFSFISNYILRFWFSFSFLRFILCMRALSAHTPDCQKRASDPFRMVVSIHVVAGI